MGSEIEPLLGPRTRTRKPSLQNRRVRKPGRVRENAAGSMLGCRFSASKHTRAHQKPRIKKCSGYLPSRKARAAAGRALGARSSGTTFRTQRATRKRVRPLPSLHLSRGIVPPLPPCERLTRKMRNIDTHSITSNYPYLLSTLLAPLPLFSFISGRSQAIPPPSRTALGVGETRQG